MVSAPHAPNAVVQQARAVVLAGAPGAAASHAGKHAEPVVAASAAAAIPRGMKHRGIGVGSSATS